MVNPIEQFRNALITRGIIPPVDLVADGNLHRCDADGPNGKGDAAYVLHLDGVPAGGFQNWRDGGGWQNWRADFGRALTSTENAEHQAKIEAAREKYEADQTRRRAKASDRAAKIWGIATPCAGHPYLTQKGIQPHGVRIYKDLLVIPIRDAIGCLRSLQFIDTNGNKKYLAGGQVQGCYFEMGAISDVIYIVEGMATGASVYDAQGEAVVVAFDAGNLPTVAKALREKYPSARLVLCADDDLATGGNPGQTKATEAARAVGGIVALPDFGPNRPAGATDFNDLHQMAGLDAVRRCISAAMQNSARPDSAVENGRISGIGTGQAGDATPGQEVVRFNCAGGRFEVSRDGVFFVEVDANGNERPQWICSPIYVRAKTRDAKNGEWGRLLEWTDDDHVLHQWAMPLELLQGDGADVRRELARQGVSIATGRGARDKLATYLSAYPVECRARCVERLGWHGDVYVTPSEAIGEQDESVVFQNVHSISPAMAVAGSAEDWKSNVAALAVGNSRLTFALSVAFAGPIIEIVGEDSGGFHLRGGSSSGKTTALYMTSSVWGDPRAYPRLWRATVNGLEGLASLHNDGVLILDELSQIDPKDAGEAAYLLANGQGKARASRTGTARHPARWRLLYVSAGEESLTALMERAGRRPNAGQEIRLADIESDAGVGMGIFEELHAFPAPAAFALAIKDAATRYHGAPGMAWLRRVVADRAELRDVIDEVIQQFVAEFVPKGASGQVLRVARRFGLVAFAGELATQYDLTGWPEGEAIRAAGKCFTSWLEGFGGTGNREERAILAQVRGFFEAHGASRFEDINASVEQRVLNRAGFFRTGQDGRREFLVLPQAYRGQVCCGYDPKLVTKVLLDHGWIEPGGDGRSSQKPRIPAMGTVRCFVFNSRMWESDAGS